MVASTLNKLYGYLKGFETCCYTGSRKSEVASSIFELLMDELKISFPEISASELSNFKDEIAKYCDYFLTKFYERMSKVKTSIIVKEVADKAKHDSEELSKLVSLIMQGSKQPLLCLGVGTLSGETIHSAVDLCDGCPWYLKGKFCLIWQPQLDDEAGDLMGQMFSFMLPETKYLALGMMRLTHYLMHNLGVDVNSLSSYYMLYNHMLVCSKAYELMNPSGEIREKQIQDTVELLTSPPLDRNSEKYQYYLNVLEQVFADIREGKKKYIQDIKRALDKNMDFIRSKYDEVEDAYYSLKGTGQSRYTKYHESIISSGLEVDWYKDQFKSFDEYVGFKSYYKEKDENLDLEQDQVFCIRTILINNPGKFKGRIIHIFDNPIQDRANYIQRRTSVILDDMQCDCMKRQDDGREFLSDKTLEWFVEENPTNRIGIYTFDFSNATDTLDQYFQYKVLEFIFGPEVANFWDIVSGLPKYIQHVDGTYTRYDQHCGQPQGGLSSFNDFSLAHHFIFLMDMKILGFEDNYSSEFYRVLGDDSVCNSIEPEIDYYNPDDPSYDEEGIPRSIIEIQHMDICKNFAGFCINYSKSESTHYDSLEAKLDFAKVTYRNGTFFSPVPFRLAMNYSKSNNAKLAVAIWRGARKETKCVPFMDRILDHINNLTVSAIVKSGVLDFLTPFWDPRIEFNPSWLARLRYSSAISHIRMMLSMLELQDRDRDWATSDSYDEAFLRLLSKRQIASINDTDPNHKIFKVIERNEYLVNLTKELFLMEDQDDKVLALLLSPLVSDKISNQGLVNQLIEINDTRKRIILASKSKDVDVSTVFPDFDVKFTKKMNSFSNVFMTRGIAKRPREEAVLFDNILEGMHQIDDVLGYLYPEMPMAEPLLSASLS